MSDCLGVVVTGDVDSGKSTLIGRMLFDTGSLSYGVMDGLKNTCKASGSDFEFAYLLDSLEEERKNQLTIDSTQVFLRNRKGKDFLFIDVPGHRELLNNMLCGSSYADVAVLIVDVSKSVEEQTKRHAFILKFIGIKEIIIVFNKMDSAIFKENTFEELKKCAAEFFRRIEIYPKYFIPVSAKYSENLVKKSRKMPWYKGASLLDILNLCSKKGADRDFRFPVQDIYDFDKEATAVGEVISGSIKRGDSVIVLPTGKKARIKKIKSFPKGKLSAKPKESIGLVLDGPVGLMRGQIICKEKLPGISTEISAKVLSLSDLAIEEDFIFKCATQEVPAAIQQIRRIWDTSNLNEKHPGVIIDKHDVAEVVIDFSKPMVTEVFCGWNNLGRFILENKNKEICAIGIIL